MHASAALCYTQPMRAYVQLRDPDGVVHELSHGDIIGRVWSAALHLDDARISEAHALVSLRGQELKLLALRGMFALGRKTLRELVLVPGQTIRLAPGVALEVVAVEMPEEILSLKVEGLGSQFLSGVCSLQADPPQLLPGYRLNADAVIWGTGEGWRIRIGDQPAEPLISGWEKTVAGCRLTALAVSISRVNQPATRAAGGLKVPLHIVARYDTVHIHRAGKPAAVIGGISARLVSELAMVGTSLSWESIAREIWPATTDAHKLRRKLDVSVSRLRRRLRALGIRDDLVQADGTGMFELVLYPEDRLDEQCD